MKNPPSRETFPFGTEFFSVSGVPVAVWPKGALAVTFNDEAERGFSVSAVYSNGGEPMSYEEWIRRFWGAARGRRPTGRMPTRTLFEEPSSVND